MGWESIADLNIQTPGSGVITVPNAGTPVQLVIPTSVLKNRQIHAILIQVLPANTGKIAIGRTKSVRANGAGNPSGSVMACLPPPTANIFPSANAGVPLAPASLDLINIWIDAQNSGEGVVVSFLDL